MLPITIGGVWASDEVNVAWLFDAVSLRTVGAGYKLQITVDQDRKLEKLVVEWKGRNIHLSRKGLPRINDPILKRLSLSTKDGNGFGATKSLCLTIPFNRVNLDEKSRLLATIDVVQFYFHEGSLKYWKLSEAVKGNPGTWKFTEYDAKNGELLNTDFGKADNNPFTSFDFSKGDM